MIGAYPAESQPNVWTTLLAQFVLLIGIVVVAQLQHRSVQAKHILRQLGIGLLIGFASFLATSFVASAVQSPDAFAVFLTTPFAPLSRIKHPDDSPTDKLEFLYYVAIAIFVIFSLSGWLVWNLIRGLFRRDTSTTLVEGLGIATAILGGAGAAVALVTAGSFTLF